MEEIRKNYHLYIRGMNYYRHNPYPIRPFEYKYEYKFTY